MGDIKISRRVLLRSAAVAAGGAGLATVLPGTGHAATTAPGTVGSTDAGALDALATLPIGLGLPFTTHPLNLIVPAPVAAAVPVTAALPYKSFARYDFDVRSLPPELQAYAQRGPAPLGYGVVDATGVRMALRQGKLWNHPAAQAQYGMILLDSYRLGGDVRYLDLAVKQAARLTQRAVAYGGGLFHPYDWPNSPHETTVRMPPWYSAIAQGQVLDLFTRLHQATGDMSYRATAEATFNSFLVPQVARKPWVTWVQGGNLWLDEYPRTDVALGDRTYNGHMFAALGIYQYYLLTADERARQLVQGAFTTARAVVPQVRVPGWRSVYCLQDRGDSGRYHPTHSSLNLMLSMITGDASFAADADLFHEDFPDPRVTGTVIVAAGTYRAYAFDDAGGVTATRLLTLAQTSSAPCGTRTKIRGRQGVWYQITAGTVAGYYLLERPGITYLRGTCIPMTYLPYRRGTLSTAVATAVQPAKTVGAPLPTKHVGLPIGAEVVVSQRLTINAVEYLELNGTVNGGWWVPAADVTL